MALEKEMQKFVMKNVSPDKLQKVKRSLKDNGCIDIEDEREDGAYTVTALCPKNDEAM